MRCHCCGLGVPCSRKVKIRPMPDYGPPQVGRHYPALPPAYVKAGTFHWSFICQTCYSVLDNEWGVDVITGQGFNLGGVSRMDKAATVDEAKYAAFLRREAAKLGPDLHASLAWEGGTVVNLARSIDRERAFERLPILADALEEAGCAHADLLSRCRFSGPFFRACWSVDMLLASAAQRERE